MQLKFVFKPFNLISLWVVVSFALYFVNIKISDKEKWLEYRWLLLGKFTWDIWIFFVELLICRIFCYHPNNYFHHYASIFISSFFHLSAQDSVFSRLKLLVDVGSRLVIVCLALLLSLSLSFLGVLVFLELCLVNLLDYQYRRYSYLIQLCFCCKICCQETTPHVLVYHQLSCFLAPTTSI